MGRWRSEYRRTHRGPPSDQLLTTWRENFTERCHLRKTMMSSHFQLGVGNGSSSSSSTESLSGDVQLSPTRLRLRHLALTSPERAPPAPAITGGRSVRFEMAPEGERSRETAGRPREATERPREAAERPRETARRPREETDRPEETSVQDRRPLTFSEAPTSSSAPPSHAVIDRPRPSTAPAARADSSRAPAAGSQHRRRQRSRSPGPLGSPLLGYGRGERGCDVGDQRTYNVMAPPTQMHDSARVAAGRRQAAQLRRDAALDTVLNHGRPPPRPASLWTTEYQRCFCQPVWTAERLRSRQQRSGGLN